MKKKIPPYGKELLWFQKRGVKKNSTISLVYIFMGPLAWDECRNYLQTGHGFGLVLPGYEDDYFEYIWPVNNLNVLLIDIDDYYSLIFKKEFAKHLLREGALMVTSRHEKNIFLYKAKLPHVGQSNHRGDS